jgi:hypothetical protein
MTKRVILLVSKVTADTFTTSYSLIVLSFQTRILCYRRIPYPESYSLFFYPPTHTVFL